MSYYGHVIRLVLLFSLFSRLNSFGPALAKRAINLYKCYLEWTNYNGLQYSSHRLGQGKIIFSVCRYCFLSMFPSALDQVWVLTNVMTMTPLRGRLLPSIVMPPWRLITFIDYILWQHWIPDKNRKQNIKLARSACVCSGKNCQPRGF